MVSLNLIHFFLLCALYSYCECVFFLLNEIPTLKHNQEMFSLKNITVHDMEKKECLEVECV